MSLKIVRFRTARGRYIVPVLVAAAIILALYSARLDLAASVAYRGLDRRSPQSRVLADWIVDTAPSDPYARLAAARYFDRTFEPDDERKALSGFEMATALSPHHYGLWLELGAARDRYGDADGAEAAYEEALKLAPSYASVAWAYGNSLIRHGKIDQGFALIGQAAASNSNYSEPAASTALQAFAGDADQVRRVLGSSSSTNAAIANVLAVQKKWPEAFDAWSRIEKADRTTNFEQVGQRLVTLMNDAHQTRLAASIYSDLLGDETDKPAIGSIANGGFEGGLKLRNAGIFEWQIGEGTDPQIGLSDAVKRSGHYSLFILFDSFEASEFRPISQRVGVVPGATYVLEGFYRADIKSNAAFKWEIVDVEQVPLGTSAPLARNADWASLTAKFTVPANTDGIVIRFIRTGCGSVGACPVTGKIYFDDFGIRQL